jgi:hypothetical protein
MTPKVELGEGILGENVKNYKGKGSFQLLS